MKEIARIAPRKSDATLARPRPTLRCGRADAPHKSLIQEIFNRNLSPAAARRHPPFAYEVTEWSARRSQIGRPQDPSISPFTISRIVRRPPSGGTSTRTSRRSTAVTLSLFAAFFRIINGKDEKTGAPIYAHSCTWALSDVGVEDLSGALVRRSQRAARWASSASRTGAARAIRASTAPSARSSSAAACRRPIASSTGRCTWASAASSSTSPARASPRTTTAAIASQLSDKSGRRLRLHVPSREAGHPPRRRRRGARPRRRGHVLLLHPALRASTARVTFRGARAPVAKGQGWYDHEFGGPRTATGAVSRSSTDRRRPTASRRRGLELGRGAARQRRGADARTRWCASTTARCSAQWAIHIDARRLSPRLSGRSSFVPDAAVALDAHVLRLSAAWTLRVPEAGIELTIDAASPIRSSSPASPSPRSGKAAATCAAPSRGRDVGGAGLHRALGLRAGRATSTNSSPPSARRCASRSRRSCRWSRRTPGARADRRRRSRRSTWTASTRQQIARSLVQAACARSPIAAASRGARTPRSPAATSSRATRASSCSGSPSPSSCTWARSSSTTSRTSRRCGAAARRLHLIYGEPLAINAGTAGYFITQRLLAHQRGLGARQAAPLRSLLRGDARRPRRPGDRPRRPRRPARPRGRERRLARARARGVRQASAQGGGAGGGVGAHGRGRRRRHRRADRRRRPLLRGARAGVPDHRRRPQPARLQERPQGARRGHHQRLDHAAGRQGDGAPRSRRPAQAGGDPGVAPDRSA